MATMFDVCVIGSGPAGGVLAKELAEGGAKVALIEAGRRMTPQDFYFHSWPYQYPYRDTPRARSEPFYPVEVTEGIRYEGSDRIEVDRIRAVGGRSIHWNAVCLRFAERDFREKSIEGIEQDWPISYADLAPYYSYVERMIGVSGSREHLDIVPDGEYLPPLKFRCSEEIVKRGCDKLNIPMIPVRKAVLTKPYDGRPACHYCGHCMDGCDVGAIFSTANSMIPKAHQTGNFTLMESRVARQLLVDDEGRVRAVSLVNPITRQEEQVQAKLFAVCCATIESARLLLNSKCTRFPNGLANSSDLVGRYLTGHVTHVVSAYLGDLMGTRPVNNDGATDHAYIPRFNANDSKRGFAGGYHYQPQISNFWFPHQAHHLKGFGTSFKKRVRQLQPGFFNLAGFGKVVAQYNNRVTVDPSHLDAYGIPIPVIRFRWSENDLAVWRDMKEKADAMMQAAKATLVIHERGPAAGFASHETGTARMGNDPKTSVLNAYCRSHDVKNLFVVDGSCFTTFPEKNPTLTIMALAVRTARHIMEESRRGEFS